MFVYFYKEKYSHFKLPFPRAGGGREREYTLLGLKIEAELCYLWSLLSPALNVSFEISTKRSNFNIWRVLAHLTVVAWHVNVQLGHAYQDDSKKYVYTTYPYFFSWNLWFNKWNTQQATLSLLCKSDTLLQAQLLRYRVIRVSE